jgi:hypothetical protein
MRRLPSRKKAQSGLVMMGLVALVVMGSLWWLISGVAQPSNRTALNRAHNAKVLQQAKTALIGYVATRAATAGQNDPGSLPCPEAPGNIGNPTQEGITAPNCSLPAVGRLPWRTLGIEKPLDIAGEPLWYVVSPGWAKPDSTTNTFINSDTQGQIFVDGVESVAVIIAPGQRLTIPASANCPARNQARNVPSPAIDFRDYLDCQNATAADLNFASSDPVGPFNDQVLGVTAVEVLPGIEAAVASRFEHELAPLMRTAYMNHPDYPNPAWNVVRPPLLPHAAPFGDPTVANFKGATGTTRGLLPFVQGYKPCSCPIPPGPPCECTPAACTAGPDCDPNFVIFEDSSGPDPNMFGSNIFNADCDRTTTEIVCTFNIRQPLPLFGPPADHPFTVTGIVARRVGRALKQFQPEAPMPGVLPSGRTLKGTLNADNTATITLTGNVDASTPASNLSGFVDSLLCSLTAPLTFSLGCKQGTIRVPHTILVDHRINDSGNQQYGWFVRNRWHQLSYYAVVPGMVPGGSASCSPGSDCLTITDAHLPDSQKNRYRSLIVIAGRGLSGQTRSGSTNPSDWFEGENADFSAGHDLTYVTRELAMTVNRSFNDRIAVIDRF